jgi:hypothetical protein
MPAPEAWRCGGYENPGGVLLLEGEPTASFDLGRPDPPPNTAELTRVSYWGEAVTVWKWKLYIWHWPVPGRNPGWDENGQWWVRRQKSPSISCV